MSCSRTQHSGSGEARTHNPRSIVKHSTTEPLSSSNLHDKLNGCVDPDSLNKAVDLLLVLLLAIKLMKTRPWFRLYDLFRGFTCCGLTLIVK